MSKFLSRKVFKIVYLLMNQAGARKKSWYINLKKKTTL